MNKQNNVANLFFSIVLIIGWAGILFASFLMYLTSDMFRLLSNGIFVYATGLIYALAFVLPVIFRKQISKHLSMPLSLVVSAILSVIVVGCILGCAQNYISDFSQEKWNDNERLRKYMIEDLEQNYGIIGKTDKEIVDLLGEPIYISDEQNFKYEYYVGESMIDSFGYQLEFENHIVVNVKLFEH